MAGLLIGIRVACDMQQRVAELRELERMIRILEGEIRYHHSILSEACCNTARRCGQPFSAWMQWIGDRLGTTDSWETEGNPDMGDGTDMGDEADKLGRIWDEAVQQLYRMSHLSVKDMEMVKALSRCIGQLDIEAQEQSFALECENIHICMLQAERELANKMKLSVSLAAMTGILIVVLLL